MFWNDEKECLENRRQKQQVKKKAKKAKILQKDKQKSKFENDRDKKEIPAKKSASNKKNKIAPITSPYSSSAF